MKSPKVEIDVEGSWAGRRQTNLGGGDNRETIMKYAAPPYYLFIDYRSIVQSIVLTLLELPDKIILTLRTNLI